MAKIFRCKPRPATQKLIEKFEDEVMIRYKNQQLVGTVYVDMQDDRWAVAFACNLSRKPGLHGHENTIEVRYSCPVQQSGTVRMFRSEESAERTLVTEPPVDWDAFIRYALMQERTLVGKTA